MLPLPLLLMMATRLSRKLKSETCRTSKTSTRIYVAQVLLGKLTQKRSSSKNRHQHQFHFNVSVLLVCTPHTHTPGGGKKRWRREIMLINRSDTCRCTLLPNGHAPRNMHRILLFPPLPPCPTLHSCCGLWTRHPALPQTARGVYTSFTWNERQRFCNFFREKKKRTSWKCRTDGRDLPNKVVNYTWLDESTPFPSLTLRFAQSSADNKATPVGERDWEL